MWRLSVIYPFGHLCAPLVGGVYVVALVRKSAFFLICVEFINQAKARKRSKCWSKVCGGDRS